MARYQHRRNTTANNDMSSSYEGELGINLADMEIFVGDATPTPQKVLGLKKFFTTAHYDSGELVNYNDSIYKSNTIVTPGAWNAGEWDQYDHIDQASDADIRAGTGAGEYVDAEQINTETVLKNSAAGDQTMDNKLFCDDRARVTSASDGSTVLIVKKRASGDAGWLVRVVDESDDPLFAINDDGEVRYAIMKGYCEQSATHNDGAIDYRYASLFYVTPAGNITITPATMSTDFPTDAVLSGLLMIDNTGGHTISWPGSTTWLGGVPASWGTKFAVTLVTPDRGSTYLATYNGEYT